MSDSARTMAKPIRCVKLTFMPEVLTSWSLSAARFTSSRRAGTVLTEVAVGTPRLATMFDTIRAAAPRSGVASGTGATAGTLAGEAEAGLDDATWV